MSKTPVMSDPMYDAFIREVKKRIAEKGYTQAKVAEKIGMTKNNFCLGLNGYFILKTIYVLLLAKFLKIRVDWITGVTPLTNSRKIP